jgi:hypothetical protein
MLREEISHVLKLKDKKVYPKKPKPKAKAKKKKKKKKSWRNYHLILFCNIAPTIE